MFDKGKRAQRHEKEDAAFNKMLLWLVGAVVAELFILLVKKVYVDFLFGVDVAEGMMYFFQAYRFLGIALTIAGVVWAVLNARKGKPVTVPCACTAAAAGIWVLAVLSYVLYEVGLSIMMLLPAVAAVLIVIFFLYQRLFFFNALLAAGGLLLLWLHRQYYTDHPTMIIVFFVAGFVLLAAALVLTFLLRKDDGKLGGFRIMPPDTAYLTTWITCGVTALAMALALILGTMAAFYLLFALMAWVFVQTVFFTVKLM